MDTYVNIDAQALMRPDDYTGCWEAHWPNGRLKYRGNFVNGVEVGQQVCYWEDGTIAQVSWRDSTGVPRGTTVSFYPDGDKQTEEIWDDNDRHPGTFTRRTFDANGDLINRVTYRQFEQVEAWEKPLSPDMAELWKSLNMDKRIKDAVREVVRNVDSSDDADEIR